MTSGELSPSTSSGSSRDPYAIYGSGMRLFLIWSGRTLLGLLAAAALIYVGDFALYQLRGHPLVQVTVTRYMTVPLKGTNKTDFYYEGTGPLNCSKSLFPQDSWSPCWYLRRHPLFAEKA